MKKQLTVLAVLWVLFVVGTGAIPVVAHDDDHGGYLAMGDSVPFGFNPLISATQRANPDLFVGYPEAFAALHHLLLTNLSCPGETSASLISRASPDNGCGRYRSRFPLHTTYAGSQLAYAVAFLKERPQTELVSISIGHNDLVLLEKACNNVETCEAAGLPSMLSHLAQNLRVIYSAIRASGYEGALVAVTYYAQNYRDAREVTLIRAVDRVLATVTREFEGDIANGFRAYQKVARHFAGDSCAASLLIVLSESPRSCDFHPSSAGRELLARTMSRAVEQLD